MLEIGAPLDWRLDGSSAYGGDVAAIAFRRRTVELHKHGIFDLATECRVYRV